MSEQHAWDTGSINTHGDAPFPPAAVVSRLSLAGKAFVLVVVGAGVAVAASALAELSSGGVPSQWIILAALTLFSGIFPARIPALRTTLSVSETLVLGLVLLFGPAPAIATVAANGLIASARVRRWSVHRTLVNIAQPVLAVWSAAMVFYALSGLAPLFIDRVVPVSTVLLPLAALAATYFLVHALIAAVSDSLESDLSVREILIRNRLDLWLNYCVTLVLLAFLVRNAGNVSALAISASAIVLGLIWLSYTSSQTYIAHVESTNRHLAELNELYLSTVETLASAIDAKDQVTSGHIRRVQQSALRLAQEVGVTDAGEIKALECASLLHDLGKLVVPEHILNKPGALSGTEFEQMKRHASIGAEILSNVRFPYPVEPIVRHHHENWDGSGYPAGLSGEAIPLGARILSVVDCFDALTSDRPYRRELSREAALDIVRSRRGSMYDPRIVDAFLDIYLELDVAQERKPAPSALGLAAPEPETPGPEDRSTPAPLPSQLRMQVQAGDVGAGSDDRHTRLRTRFTDTVARRSDALPSDAILVIYRRDSAAETLRAYWVSSDQYSWIRRLSIPMGQAVSGWVAANQRAVINAEPLADFQAAGQEVGQEVGDDGRAFRSCISAPIETDAQVVGVVTIYSSQSVAFNEHSEAIARSIADEIAPALDPFVTRSESAATADRHRAVAVI